MLFQEVFQYKTQCPILKVRCLKVTPQIRENQVEFSNKMFSGVMTMAVRTSKVFAKTVHVVYALDVLLESIEIIT